MDQIDLTFLRENGSRVHVPLGLNEWSNGNEVGQSVTSLYMGFQPHAVVLYIRFQDMSVLSRLYLGGGGKHLSHPQIVLIFQTVITIV